MRRCSLLFPFLALAVAALPGCSGGGGKGSCSEEQRKAAVLQQVRSYYLYQELLPATVDLSAYSSADALLDALTATAREQGKDRGWSFLMPEADYVRYFQQGQSIGYGLSLVRIGAVPPFRVLVKQVFEASAAGAAGFVRGDEILALGTDPVQLVEVASLDASVLNALLSSGAVPEVPMAFLVGPAAGGQPELRTLRSATYEVDPVPSVKRFGTTGYVQLRTFISAAHEELLRAFASFRDGGVENVVVDLRYNGGGSVNTAALLADLLGQGLRGKPMFDLAYNGQHPGDGTRFLFGEAVEGGAFKRVAFITTAASASASELVPNALDAYPELVEVGYAGARTHGKPVGQMVMSLEGCGAMLFLVSFRIVNANGNVDYFEGLPNDMSSHGLCEAPDDLGHPQDSEEEASTRAAIYFAEHGECPPAPPALRAPSPAIEDHLIGSGIGPAARDMPGTF